ncbi:DEAD/DEAH box helicase [Carpediemonas membranifera]|uniref:RNA helicase n=1 Tax=Carpediemonas membranifera TaxID=201153 RepID=A0A8J6AY59_9EUKA|nr:DEAD/DEAH box helicase [Carpediemonas membranifera]|eukprot:KAG9396973.1 DEAD/DEAH box helicase [Carpediemonas membranifera]
MADSWGDFGDSNTATTAAPSSGIAGGDSWTTGPSTGGSGDSWNGGASGNAGGFGGDDGCNLGEGLNDIDFANESLTEIPKNFYHEDPIVSARPDHEIQRILRDYDITTAGTDVPRPVTTFKEAGFVGDIQAIIDDAGFTKPTPIQAQGFPVALSGRNVVGIAATGSGKTLAFLLPATSHIRAQPPSEAGQGPIALILTPTRELALQIQKESERFVETGFKIKSVCVYGGAPKNYQAGVLRNGIDIVIATPGRLIDFLQSGVTNLKRVTYLVLDEADRMLDMGFMPQVRKIVGQVRPDRQVLMWSATWPKEVETLAKDFIGDYVRINVGDPGLKACHDVMQEFIFDCFDMRSKVRRMNDILRDLRQRDGEGVRALVFTQTKRTVDELVEDICRMGFKAGGIHGDKSQRDRDAVLQAFKRGFCEVLVATDVAQRGLDIKNLNYVINFDMPNNAEDYVHRIGRTGRAGQRGTAISFFNDASARLAGPIINVLREANQPVPDQLSQMKSSGGGFGGNDRRTQYSDRWRDMPIADSWKSRPPRDRDAGRGGFGGDRGSRGGDSWASGGSRGGDSGSRGGDSWASGGSRGGDSGSRGGDSWASGGDSKPAPASTGNSGGDSWF